MSKTIYLAADHGGFRLKAHFVTWLQQNGYTAQDLGTHSEERCDTLEYAKAMAAALARDPSSLGVLICKTGNGMAMAANRFQHLRAALCHDITTARLSREHNDANVLALGAFVLGLDVATDCLKAFVTTDHLGGRYADRVADLTALGGVKV